MSLAIGSPAPQFSLMDTSRTVRSLSEFAGKKVVLVFYPGAFTGACEKEMCAFRDSLTKFNAVDAQVIGISVDSPFANKAFADKNQLTFPLLSDFNREVSNQYAGVYVGFAGVTGYQASKRAVYVLDAQHKITYIWVTEAPAVEPPYDDVVKAVA